SVSLPCLQRRRTGNRREAGSTGGTTALRLPRSRSGLGRGCGRVAVEGQPRRPRNVASQPAPERPQLRPGPLSSDGFRRPSPTNPEHLGGCVRRPGLLASPGVNLATVLLATAATDPERVALAGPVPLTYGALARRAAGMAERVAAGAGPGDRVALVA